MTTPALDAEQLAHLLQHVEKPARYTGGELNAVVKNDPVRARIALCFPDVYEVAESHIGLKILYRIVNDSPEFAAERAYAIWPDLEAKMHEQNVPLWSLETRTPLSDFDVLGFTLQYELSYTTIIAMLRLGHVPLRAKDRTESDPWVIGGGAGAFNPEPIAPFFDAFLLGDGEDAITDIMEFAAQCKAQGLSRREGLEQLARIPGMYVPELVDLEYDGIRVTQFETPPKTAYHETTSKHGTPRITRRTVMDLDQAPYPTKPIVPNVKPIHDRVAIEIQRGCSQGCRFCQAGMITRPTRQRSPEKVLELADASLTSSGSNDVGLLSLSAGDYGPINDLLSEFFERYRDERIAVGLPSMRTETMTPELAEQVASVRKSGWTFAPEAGSDRMRRVINKTNTEDDLMNAVKATVEAGWRQLKFYFMIGLPTETMDDVDAIVRLAERARKVGRQINSQVNVTVSVSTFVPKPHTSFQWEAQIGVEETFEKHTHLRKRLKALRIPFRYHDPKQSYLEGVLSRGDRRLGDALALAAERGARLDSWSEHHSHDLWMGALHDALAPHGLTPDDYLAERCEDAWLPWDHLDAGILKKYLKRDRAKSYREATVGDCAFTQKCYACGGCHLGDPYTKSKKSREEDDQLKPRTHDDLKRRVAEGRVTEAPAEQEAETYRVRFRLARLDPAAYLSHLDAMEHVLRAVRLAKLPVRYSEGHTKRPRVAFSPALSSGIESEAEYIDVDCVEPVQEREWAEGLNRYLPGGFAVVNVEEVSSRGDSISCLHESIMYRVRLAPEEVSAVRDAIDVTMAQEVIPIRIKRKRKARVVDARVYLKDVAVVGSDLMLESRCFVSGSLKIRELLAVIVGTDRAKSCAIRKMSVRLAAKPVGEPPVSQVPEHLPVLDLTTLLDAPVQEGREGTSPRDRAGVVVPYAE